MKASNTTAITDEDKNKIATIKLTNYIKQAKSLLDDTKHTALILVNQQQESTRNIQNSVFSQNGFGGSRTQKFQPDLFKTTLISSNSLIRRKDLHNHQHFSSTIEPISKQQQHQQNCVPISEEPQVLNPPSLFTQDLTNILHCMTVDAQPKKITNMPRSCSNSKHGSQQNLPKLNSGLPQSRNSYFKQKYETFLTQANYRRNSQNNAMIEVLQQEQHQNEVAESIQQDYKVDLTKSILQKFNCKNDKKQTVLISPLTQKSVDESINSMQMEIDENIDNGKQKPYDGVNLPITIHSFQKRFSQCSTASVSCRNASKVQTNREITNKENNANYFQQKAYSLAQFQTNENNFSQKVEKETEMKLQQQSIQFDHFNMNKVKKVNTQSRNALQIYNDQEHKSQNTSSLIRNTKSKVSIQDIERKSQKPLQSTILTDVSIINYNKQQNTIPKHELHFEISKTMPQSSSVTRQKVSFLKQPQKIKQPKIEKDNIENQNTIEDQVVDFNDQKTIVPSQNSTFSYTPCFYKPPVNKKEALNGRKNKQ